jgi:4-oxalocrotonate tautomerase
MLKGRTIEQKRRLVERMTDAMAEEAKTPKEGVVVTIVEIEREDYARGGVLMADRFFSIQWFDGCSSLADVNHL